MSDEYTVATPDPATVSIVAGIIRHILSGLGALGVGLGAVGDTSDSNIYIAAGALCWVAAAIWSLWQKYSAQKKLKMAALASARAGRPVEPSTQPPPP